jgi:hypothetical protein
MFYQLPLRAGFVPKFRYQNTVLINTLKSEDTFMDDLRSFLPRHRAEAAEAHRNITTATDILILRPIRTHMTSPSVRLLIFIFMPSVPCRSLDRRVTVTGCMIGSLQRSIVMQVAHVDLEAVAA